MAADLKADALKTVTCGTTEIRSCHCANELCTFLQLLSVYQTAGLLFGLIFEFPSVTYGILKVANYK